MVCRVGVGAPKACPRPVAEGREWCLFAAAGTVHGGVVCLLIWFRLGVGLMWQVKQKGLAREKRAQVYVRVCARAHPLSLSPSLALSFSACFAAPCWAMCAAHVRPSAQA